MYLLYKYSQSVISLIFCSPPLFILYIDTNYTKPKTWTSIPNFQIFHQKSGAGCYRISIFFFNLNFLPPNGILWKISQNSHENSWIWGSFFNFTRSLENVSVEDVFLQNLQFFLEQLFDRTPVNSYSWNL